MVGCDEEGSSKQRNRYMSKDKKSTDYIQAMVKNSDMAGALKV